MKIEKTTDGRYIKTISKEIKGLMGRLYMEIEDRRESIDAVEIKLGEIANRMDRVGADFDVSFMRVSEIILYFEDMFPYDQDYGIFDRQRMVMNDIEARGDVVIDGTLVVRKTVNPNDRILFDRLFDVAEDFTARKNATVLQDLTVGGNTAIGGDATVTGNAEIAGNANVVGDFNVVGKATFGSLELDEFTAERADFQELTTSIATVYTLQILPNPDDILPGEGEEEGASVPAIMIESQTMIPNLHAEFFGGHSADDFVLQGELLLHGHDVATTTEDGFMSSADKVALGKAVTDVVTLEGKTTTLETKTATLEAQDVLTQQHIAAQTKTAMFYRQGGEFQETTGGWVEDTANDLGIGIREKEANHLFLETSSLEGKGKRGWATTTATDFTTIHTLYIDWEIGGMVEGVDGETTEASADVVLFDDLGVEVRRTSQTTNTNRMINAIDTYDLIGPHIIKIYANDHSETVLSPCKVKTFKVWGEL